MKLSGKRTFIIPFLILNIVIFTVVLGFNKESITIGFIGDFSGESKDLGVQSRNGAIMAVEDINHLGGIDGRELILESHDIKKGVEHLNYQIIIGPLLSKRAASVSQHFKGRGILISPSVSSDNFNNIDDNLFRINSAASIDGNLMGRTLADQNYKSVLAIYSEYNSEYTSQIIRGVTELLDNRSISSKTYKFKGFGDIEEIRNIIESENIDAVAISSTGDVAGKIVQRLSDLKIGSYIFCQWGKSTGLLEYGGKSAEGTLAIGGGFDMEDEFKKRYLEKYHHQANFSAHYSYEAVMTIYYAFLNRKFSYDYNYIKESLLDTEYFNEFGDSVKSKRVYIIRNGKYEEY